MNGCRFSIIAWGRRRRITRRNGGRAEAEAYEGTQGEREAQRYTQVKGSGAVVGGVGLDGGAGAWQPPQRPQPAVRATERQVTYGTAQQHQQFAGGGGASAGASAQQRPPPPSPSGVGVPPAAGPGVGAGHNNDFVMGGNAIGEMVQQVIDAHAARHAKAQSQKKRLAR